MERVSDLLREVAADVLRRVKDPGLGDDLVSITQVKVSPDLSSAKFLVSTLAAPERRPQILEGLNRASGFIRHEINRQVSLKRIPQVSFAYDPSLEQGARLLSLINEAARGLPALDEQGDSGPNNASDQASGQQPADSSDGRADVQVALLDQADRQAQSSADHTACGPEGRSKACPQHSGPCHHPQEPGR